MKPLDLPISPKKGTASKLRALAVLLAALTCLIGSLSGAIAGSTPWGAGYLPNFQVLDQDGKPRKFYDELIKDKIVVVAFIYTTCKDICPLITARLGLLEDKLGGAVGRDVHFVLVSIDPENDTPARLKAYADGFNAGAGWTFVTGQPAEIAEIRHKLGERSRELNEHRNDLMLGNDRTGQWARDSAFSDINILAINVMNMDPETRMRADAKVQDLGEVRENSIDQRGRILFTKTCASCHTIGLGDRIGPDLSGLLERRDLPWIDRYLKEPERVRGSGDAVAIALSQKYRAVRMPNLGLSEHDIEDLLTFIRAEDAAGRTAGYSASKSHPK